MWQVMRAPLVRSVLHHLHQDLVAFLEQILDLGALLPVPVALLAVSAAALGSLPRLAIAVLAPVAFGLLAGGGEPLRVCGRVLPDAVPGVPREPRAADRREAARARIGRLGAGAWLVPGELRRGVRGSARRLRCLRLLGRERLFGGRMSSIGFVELFLVVVFAILLVLDGLVGWRSTISPVRRSGRPPQPRPERSAPASSRRRGPPPLPCRGPRGLHAVSAAALLPQAPEEASSRLPVARPRRRLRQISASRGSPSTAPLDIHSSEKPEVGRDDVADVEESRLSKPISTNAACIPGGRDYLSLVDVADYSFLVLPLQ